MGKVFKSRGGGGIFKSVEEFTPLIDFYRFVSLHKGLVRSNTEAQMKLRACDGLSVLVRALDSEEEKIRVKSAFLMSALCSTEPAFKGWSSELVAVGS